MRCRGQITIFFLCIILLSGIAHAEIPSHENFSDAEEDLFSLLSFLADTSILCEETITHSYEANVTLLFDSTVEIDFHEEKRNQSLLTSNQLKKRISYSTDVLDLLEKNVASYRYLKDLLLPLKKIGTLAISVTNYHSHLINEFITLINLTLAKQSEYDETAIVSHITSAHQKIRQLHENIDSMETLYPQIDTFFSTNQLSNQTKKFSFLLDRYESYLTQFVFFFSVEEPKLVLYTDNTDYYLKETINISGYFIGSDGLVSNQTVKIYFDNESFTQVTTNDFGGYNTSYHTTAFLTPTTHQLYAETIHESETYLSEPVSIMLHLIPTTLSINLPHTHFRPKETIQITGQLSTLNTNKIKDSIQLIIADQTYLISTNETGFFSINLSNQTQYGAYTIQGIYEPNELYESCSSEKILFYIDEPTFLSIQTNKKNITNKEIISISGKLQESVTTKAIKNQTISLLVNDKIMQKTITNNTGCYSFDYTTENLSGSQLYVQTKYTSTEKQWRSTYSQVLTITISQGILSQLNSLFLLFADILLPIFFIVIISCIMMLLYVYRIKKTKRRKKILHDDEYRSALPHISRLKQESSYKNDSKTSNTVSPTFIPLKQRIITTYRMMLRFLSNQGMELKDTFTHKDIQQRLYTTTLPKNTIDEVTLSFEHARYSPYPTADREIQIFDEQVFSIITDYKK